MSDPMNLDRAILVWRFWDAPEAYRELSGHGGDEYWVAFIPDDVYRDECGMIDWCSDYPGARFGVCDVSEHRVAGGYVRIGAHA